MIKNTYTKGENTINIKDITVKTGSDSKIYDGRKLSSATLSILSGELNTGDKLTYDETNPVPSITNAGSITNVLTPKVVDSGTGEDHTANYNITVNCGTLTIDKRNVTLVSSGFEAQYSAKYYSNPDVAVLGQGFVYGEVTSVKSTGKFKDVGVYENKPIVIEWAEGANPNNYDITYKYGTITIDASLIPKPIIPTQGATISGDGGTSSHDIKPITSHGDDDGSKF